MSPGWFVPGLQGPKILALDTADSGGHGVCLPPSLSWCGLWVDSGRWTRFSEQWPGPGQVTVSRVYLSELGKIHCTAGHLRRHNRCLSMSIVSAPLMQWLL